MRRPWPVMMLMGGSCDVAVDGLAFIIYYHMGFVGWMYFMCDGFYVLNTVFLRNELLTRRERNRN